MSIIATVIGLVILILRKTLHKWISPKCYSMIWLVFIIALICPVPIPSSISIYNYFDVESVKQSEKQYANDVLSLPNEENGQEEGLKLKEKIKFNYESIGKNYLVYIISDIWFIAFLLLLSRVIYQYARAIYLTGSLEIEDERINNILEKCKKKLKIKRNIKLIEQYEMQRPCTMGVFKVKIFLSDNMFEMDEICLTDIFMHELSHYKRKDNLLNVFIMFAKAVHCFNPIIYFGLMNCLKVDMELATDEMAIENLGQDERDEYSRIIVNIAGIESSRFEAVLGLSEDVKILGKRIDTVLMKDEFEKHAKVIMGFTILIVLFMWLVLYPTSYGMFSVPRLYLEMSDGSVIAVTRMEDKKEGLIKTISLSKGEALRLVVEGGRCEDYVIYGKEDLRNKEGFEGAIDIKEEKICCFQEGEYIYKFTLKHGNRKSTDYQIKIIVE